MHDEAQTVNAAASHESTANAESAANKALIERFYGAFARRDVEAMLACYHLQVVFTDPVFGTLAAEQVCAMWRMLTGRARDLRVEFRDVTATERNGRARWDAWYSFSRTGRLVHS